MRIEKKQEKLKVDKIHKKKEKRKKQKEKEKKEKTKNMKIKERRKMHSGRRHFVILCGGAARFESPSLPSAIAGGTVHNSVETAILREKVATYVL